MSTVDFVWFDLGYTLLYNLRVPLYRQLMGGHGIDLPLERLELAFHRGDKLFMREYPGVLGTDFRTYLPWYLGALNYSLSLRLDLCRLFERWVDLIQGAEDYWRAYDFVPGALDRLEQRGLRLGVITNWDHTARPILARQGLIERFERIIVSSEVGCAKPDPRIFELALEGLGVPASRCLYVGDNYYDDAVGSRAAGMRCLIVNRFGRGEIEELEQIDPAQLIIRDVREVEQHLP